MPELRYYYGYPMAIGIMVAVATGLIVYFWRKGWLRRW
jgi:magnesium transporter